VSVEKQEMGQTTIAEKESLWFDYLTLLTIKIKNCKGYDIITQRILIDGAIHLASPLKILLDLIYSDNEIPSNG
jgi:hypothetical protein